MREEKARLRAELRAARRALPEAALARAATAVAALAARFAPLSGARTIAGYVACDGEIDVAAILAAARSRGATTLLPRRVAPGVLELVPAPDGATLCASGPAGIPEPDGSACELALVPPPAVALAPAVALDRHGFRLGRGGGDYDRLVPRLHALGWTIVGVCHASAIVDALPVEPHDQRVDAILTEAGLLALC